uniref:Uncharacterized protein n=1 Tax=Glossina palpalis gambiensis TaxID=67801 RepID=A0A1B0B3G1_9MUSC
MKTKNLHKYRPTKITTCLVSFNLLQNEFNSCIASNQSKLEHSDVDFPLPSGLFPAVICFVSAFIGAFGCISILGTSPGRAGPGFCSSSVNGQNKVKSVSRPYVKEQIIPNVMF